MIDLLTGSHRAFAKIADRPEVTLVHDDGRAHLTRTDQRFDVIQMSLVDTWAATGAGAFTLSENGLYTLDALAGLPEPADAGRRAQRVALVRSRQRVGDEPPARARRRRAPRSRRRAARAISSCSLVSGRVATLMVSSAPFTTADRDRLDSVATIAGFEIARRAMAAGRRTALLGRISRSTHGRRARAGDGRPALRLLPTDRPSSVLLQHAASPRALFELRLELSRYGALGGNLRPRCCS